MIAENARYGGRRVLFLFASADSCGPDARPRAGNNTARFFVFAVGGSHSTGVCWSLGDTLMVSAAPCRIRTSGRERAALHSMALSPAHEKCCDRRRARTTATRPARPVPGPAAGEPLGFRGVHDA